MPSRGLSRARFTTSSGAGGVPSRCAARAMVNMSTLSVWISGRLRVHLRGGRPLCRRRRPDVQRLATGAVCVAVPKARGE